eukprot:211958-Alexandrium_andersonii.AAC.1
MAHCARPPTPGGSRSAASSRRHPANCCRPRRPPSPQTQAADRLGPESRPQTQTALPQAGLRER